MIDARKQNLNPSPHLSFSVESGITSFTSIWLLSCVEPQVGLKRVIQGETFPTDTADMRLDPQMRVLMSRED